MKWALARGKNANLISRAKLRARSCSLLIRQCPRRQLILELKRRLLPVGNGFVTQQQFSRHTPTVHINPDHFLQTPQGRVWTKEANAKAWEACYVLLDRALSSADADTRVFVLIGPQGAGKTTWARTHLHHHPDDIVFDAILVQRFEREPIIRRATARGLKLVAVYFQTPLDQCLKRNALRPADEIASERGLRNVFAAVQPPELEEGFSQIVHVAA